jgi:hypothetical protein
MVLEVVVQVEGPTKNTKTLLNLSLTQHSPNITHILNHTIPYSNNMFGSTPFSFRIKLQPATGYPKERQALGLDDGYYSMICNLFTCVFLSIQVLEAVVKVEGLTKSQNPT